VEKPTAVRKYCPGVKVETILTLRNSSGWSLLSSAVIGRKATFEALFTSMDEEIWQDQVRWRLFFCYNYQDIVMFDGRPVDLSPCGDFVTRLKHNTSVPFRLF